MLKSAVTTHVACQAAPVTDPVASDLCPDADQLDLNSHAGT